MMNYATELGYTDRRAYEVVRVVTEKTIEVRRMNATRDKSVELEFHVGGFSAHCSNQNDQKWTFESDESNPVIRIRKLKYGPYYTNSGTKFRLDETPCEFYDYNF